MDISTITTSTSPQKNTKLIIGFIRRQSVKISSIPLKLIIKYTADPVLLLAQRGLITFMYLAGSKKIKPPYWHIYEKKGSIITAPGPIKWILPLENNLFIYYSGGITCYSSANARYPNSPYTKVPLLPALNTILPLSKLSKMSILDIATNGYIGDALISGGSVVFVTTSDNRVFARGDNQFSRLGLESSPSNTNYTDKWTELPLSKSSTYVIKKIYPHELRTFFVIREKKTDDEKIYFSGIKSLKASKVEEEGVVYWDVQFHSLPKGKKTIKMISTTQGATAVALTVKAKDVVYSAYHTIPNHSMLKPMGAVNNKIEPNYRVSHMSLAPCFPVKVMIVSILLSPKKQISGKNSIFLFVKDQSSKITSKFNEWYQKQKSFIKAIFLGPELSYSNLAVKSDKLGVIRIGLEDERSVSRDDTHAFTSILSLPLSCHVTLQEIEKPTLGLEKEDIDLIINERDRQAKHTKK